MPRQFERPYLALLTGAAAWAAVNCVYVYVIAGEGAAFRIESAALIFGLLALPLLVTRTREQPRSAPSTTVADGVGLAALVAVWLAVLGPLISFPFLSDDYGFLASYRSLVAVATPFQFYRPLFAAVFAMLARLGGGSATAFHATAFALHIASSWLVYRLAQRLTRGPALVAAAVFLLNPVQLEAVLWASGLQEVLWTFFLLAALTLYVHREQFSSARLGGMAALVAAALWSKETAVCIVVLLPLLELITFGFKRIRTAAVVWLGAALECTLYLALRSRSTTIDNAFFVRPSHYFAKQMLVIPYEVFIHPWNRSAMEVPRSALCAAALVMIALACLALWRGASRSALSGPVLIFASVLPVYSLFYVAPDLAGSRYLYFGAAGFGLLAAELCGPVGTMTRVAATAVITVLFTVSLSLNLRPWRSAADLVDAIQEAIVAGENPRASIETWAATHAAGLVLNGGIPDSYQGVWVFRNGYREFVERVRR